jgi:ribosome-associated protein
MNTKASSGRLNSAMLNSELDFTASRSEGPGGQNVNKVNSKITLRWDIINSLLISDEEKRVIKEELASFITKDGVLILSAQDKRSQLQNKEAVLQKLDWLLVKAFEIKKQRKPTKPSKAAKAERVRKKKMHSQKKQWRQNFKSGDI